MNGAPLAGVKVLAVEQAVAAPLCTRHLAELGAEVIKIERPGEGDFARRYDEAAGGESTHFVWLNRGKRSVGLDLKHPDGWQAFLDLVSTADVLVVNLSPSASQRLIDDPDVLDANARLIRCAISGYGMNGPYRDRKAFDLLVQGEAGVTLSTGTPEHPAKPGVSLSDLSAGVYALAAIAAALAGRAPGSPGERIEVSLFDATAEWMMPLLLAQVCTGETPPPTGTRHATICPYGPFLTRDAEVVNIAVQNDGQWGRLCRFVLDRPDLVGDERYSGNGRRLEHREDVEGIVASAVAEHTLRTVTNRLDRAGVPWGRLNSVEDVVDHVQLLERERWTDARLPNGELVPVLKSPIQFEEGTSPTGSRAVPSRGQHTFEVLKRLGYGADRIERMRTAGAVEVADSSEPGSNLTADGGRRTDDPLANTGDDLSARGGRSPR